MERNGIKDSFRMLKIRSVLNFSLLIIFKSVLASIVNAHATSIVTADGKFNIQYM